MQSKQRLAVFLDGTWNTRDDSTNVQHLHTLTREGVMEDGVVQHRYYHQGVGTGVMDSFTGGGFGFGLEGNVRAAYNWLVEQYNDGDETYVFGFSRGAFTARSLVGFISTCGLMHRGAPLTVSQLWQGYCKIGREREEKTDWWDEFVGIPPLPFRRLSDLKWDDGRPKAAPQNCTEEMLVAYSRRIPIDYLGVFDTVGALGLDALAIPGLRSKMAQHHNAYPTTLIKSCRHALAIDENRSSFKLTPFLEYMPNQKRDPTSVFRDTIEQRWFVGAHSNIGGGYEDNALSTRPLAWMMEGPEATGLQMHPLPPPQVPAAASQRRDSYAEFAAPIWSSVVRAKRHFRPIDRPVLAKRGYALRTINESVDESVVELAKADPTYAPPHLMAYAESAGHKELTEALAGRKSDHEWSGRTLAARAGLISWGSLAVLGASSFAQLWTFHFFEMSVLVSSLLVMACLLMDRVECYSNLATRRHGSSVTLAVLATVMQAFRLCVVGLMAIGAITLVSSSIANGWRAEDAWEGLGWLGEAFAKWGHIPIAAAVTMVVLDVIEKRTRIMRTVGALALSLVSLLGAALALVVMVMSFKHLIEVEPAPVFMSLVSPASETQAGRLLLLQIMLFIFYVSWRATGRPMQVEDSNLGSMVSLQLALTPKRVAATLTGWKEALVRHWEDDPEAVAIARRNDVVRNTLWRDITGFVPVYAPIMAITMWLGMEYGTPTWWVDVAQRQVLGVDLWIALVLMTALLDLTEDAITFGYLRAHPPALLVLFGALVTLTKLAAFAAAALVCLAVYHDLTVKVIEADLGGWRWVTASITSFIIAAFVLVRAVALVRGVTKRLRSGGAE